jgi:hypothetical protein
MTFNNPIGTNDRGRITSRFLIVFSEFSIEFDSFLDLRLSDFTGFLFHDVDGGVN